MQEQDIVSLILYCAFVPLFILSIPPILFMTAQKNIVSTRRVLFIMLLPTPVLQVFTLAVAIVSLLLRNYTEGIADVVSSLTVLRIIGETLSVVSVCTQLFTIVQVMLKVFRKEITNLKFVNLSRAASSITYIVFLFLFGLAVMLILVFTLMSRLGVSNGIRYPFFYAAAALLIIGSFAQLALLGVFTVTAFKLYKLCRTMQLHASSGSKRIWFLAATMQIVFAMYSVSIWLRAIVVWWGPAEWIATVVGCASCITFESALLFCYGPLRELQAFVVQKETKSEQTVQQITKKLSVHYTISPIEPEKLARLQDNSLKEIPSSDSLTPLKRKTSSKLQEVGISKDKIVAICVVTPQVSTPTSQAAPEPCEEPAALEDVKQVVEDHAVTV